MERGTVAVSHEHMSRTGFIYDDNPVPVPIRGGSSDSMEYIGGPVEL